MPCGGANVPAVFVIFINALAELQPRQTLQANCNHPVPSAGLDSPAITRHDFDFLVLQLVRLPNVNQCALSVIRNQTAEPPHSSFVFGHSPNDLPT